MLISRDMDCVTRLALASLLSCILATGVCAQDSTVTGRVTDSDGTPLPGVLVGRFQKFKGGGYRTDRQQTGKEGTYHSYGDGQAIFFRKLGFRPVTKLGTPSGSVLNITLEKANPAWTLKQCTSEQESRGKHFGISVLFPVPPATKVREGTPDTDNQKVWLSFPHNHKEHLLIWSGVLLGGGISYFPDESWFLGGSVVKEGLDSESGAMDVRGKTSNGQNWRSLSWATDIAEYHGVSNEQRRSSTKFSIRLA
jgi:hypothetical protein